MTENEHHSFPNPCCASWIKRSQKLEKSRDALRQSVKILEGQIERQSGEIASLKKELEKQQFQQEQQKDERIKADNIKMELEKKILEMKSKISSLENIRSSKNIDEDEIRMLKTRISAGQEEIESLKELLEKEKRKTDSEGRKIESEKKKAIEAWNLLKVEKRKAEEHKCQLEVEKKKSEDFRLSLEKLKVEANELREKLNAELAKGYNAKKQIEVEKAKACAEKKRADSEILKFEEQRKLLQEERKKVCDVNNKVNLLYQKLEEERKKNEQIQKNLDDVSTASNSMGRGQNACNALKAAKLKLLKERLKLERKRVKHAERVAKHEKYEKSFVVQEVHLLKQNLMQFLYRFNILDGLVNCNMGSSDEAQKTLNYPDLTSFKLNDLLRSKKDFSDSPTEFGPSEIHYGNPFNHAEPIGQCIGLPVSSGCHGNTKTGINSELESPVGGSLTNKPQSSAVCSTSIHFSDRKLMGSQGRDSVVEISATNLAQKRKHSLISEEFCGAKKPCLNSSTLKVVSRVNDNSSKKRKIKVLTKSLHSEDNKLQTVNGAKVASVNDQLRNVEQFSQANCSNYKKFSQEGQNDLGRGIHDHIQVEKSQFGDRKKACKSKRKHNEVVPNSSEVCIEQGVAPLGTENALLKTFEKMISGGCLKLLELDDYSDEVRYRNALERPLSPTLPEIEMSSFRHEEDDSHALKVTDSTIPLCLSEAMDLEVGSDDQNSKILTDKELLNRSIVQHDGGNSKSSTSGNLVPSVHSFSSLEVKLNEPLGESMNSDFIQNRSEVRTMDKLAVAKSLNPVLTSYAENLTKGVGFTSTEKDAGHNIQQSSVSGLEPNVSKLAFSSHSLKSKSLANDDDEDNFERIVYFFTSFSSARNVDSMPRIICALKFFSSQNFLASKLDLLITESLDRLRLEELQLEEKVAVFFSILLGNLSVRILDHCKKIEDEDSFQFLKAYALEIVGAFSAEKIIRLLNQMFRLDALLDLIASFLISREILAIGNVEQHSSTFPAFSELKFDVEVGTNCELSKVITVHQFVAGCTILASICVAIDDIGFLLSLSYKILRLFQDDITWALLALRAFSNIFGKRLFNAENHRFLAITINSVVKMLEGRLKLGSYPLSTSRMFVDFLSCKQCPFAADAVCMDKLVNTLLDMVEEYSIATMNNCCFSFDELRSMSDTKTKDSTNVKAKFDVQCDDSCAIFRYRKLAGNPSDSCFDTGFCNFTDIVSLVELVGLYMPWEWTYDKAIPRLLKILEVCICDEFLTALFVLVGELGRLGSSYVGYQQAGIAELRTKLTELLDSLIARKASLLIQVAAVGAILNMLPLKFKDIFDEHQDITLDSYQFPCIKHIQKWFLNLSGEQKVSLKGFFGDESQLRM